MDWLVNRRVLGALAAMLAVIVMVSITLRERTYLTAVEEWFHDTLAPLTTVVHSGIEAVTDTTSALAELSRLREENQRLREEVERLAAAERRIDDLEAEVQRLQSLLGLQRRVPPVSGAARIIGRSPSNWFETVTLDVGRADGIQPDSVVVNPRGVVGRVIRVTDRTAVVMLLTDAQTSVGATVTRSRYSGIVLGGHRQAGRLLMRFFDYNADVRPGDRIVTSGLGDVFPPGLELGQVELVERDPVRLRLLATIRPAVNFDRLDEVLILEPWSPEGDAGGPAAPEPPDQEPEEEP